MKTNVSIELCNTDRRFIADFIDGKTSQRKATRAEIVAICRDAVATIIRAQIGDRVREITPPAHTRSTPDPEDTEHLAGESPGHIRGWNNAKHSPRVN